VAEAENLLKDLESLDFVKSALEGKKVMKDVHEALATCENMQDDLERIAAWGTIFTEPVHFIETASKNYLYHRGEFSDDLAASKIDWSNGEYFNAGVDTADALVVLLGPVQ
jgi:hypothetical protein